MRNQIQRNNAVRGYQLETRSMQRCVPWEHKGCAQRGCAARGQAALPMVRTIATIHTVPAKSAQPKLSISVRHGHTLQSTCMCHERGAHCLERLTRPGRPPPKGELSAKSMCFWLSTRTRNEGTFTTCLPTLHTMFGDASSRGTKHERAATSSLRRGRTECGVGG